MEGYENEGKSRDKSQENETAVKLPENHTIVDPMAKFHNNKATLSYAEQLLLITDLTEKRAEKKKQRAALNLT